MSRSLILRWRLGVEVLDSDKPLPTGLDEFPNWEIINHDLSHAVLTALHDQPKLAVRVDVADMDSMILGPLVEAEVDGAVLDFRDYLATLDFGLPQAARIAFGLTADA